MHKIKEKKRSGIIITLILSVFFLLGLGLLLYPSFANYWNSQRHTEVIASYGEDVAKMTKEEKAAMWDEAVRYNEKLTKNAGAFILTESEKERYDNTLQVSKDGMMGYLEIPSIDVTLPVYHGTESRVMQIGVGHLEWSSLPVGGVNTHCVLSGHRGLPSAKLFTDLDQITEGDVFMLRVLDEVLTYQVDRILIIEPSDTSALQVEEGKDLCTLMTCTPYAVNTHRLLVTGHRIENLDEADLARVTSDAIQLEPLFVAPIMAIPLLLLFIGILLGNDFRKKRIDKSLGR